jgi:hypothetical protein
MSYVIVGNVMSTATRPRCAHGSWDGHYYSISGSRRDVCAILGCGYVVDVSAHVRAVNIRRSDEFILGQRYRSWLTNCPSTDVSTSVGPLDE